MSDITIIKLTSILLILLVALIAGIYPFKRKWRNNVADFPIGQALANGVFLGAGLIHMLGDASADFTALHAQYPWAFLIAGITFLLFLLLEHLGREYIEHGASTSKSFALLAFIMLSIHSLIEGAALGFGSSSAVVIILLIAILAHKWAASFALSVQINQSHLNNKIGLLLFVIFALMTPVGIGCGTLMTHTLTTNAYVEPVFNAIAGGTFLYLGTLHGLSRSFMIDKCCNLKNFIFVILGFALMAVVAIWS